MDLEAQQQYNQTCAVNYNARTGMAKRLIIGGYSSMGKPENCTLQYYEGDNKLEAIWEMVEEFGQIAFL